MSTIRLNSIQARTSLSKDRTRRLLREAMHRVAAGVPTNKELAKEASENRLKFTFSSVAQEAGVSRTLIGFKGCEYSDIRSEIQKLIRTKSPLAETVNRLNQEVEELREKVRRRRVGLSQLISRLYKRNRTTSCNAQQIPPIPNMLEYETGCIEAGKRETLKQQIRRLREEVKMLRRKLTKRDTLYANLVLRARANDQGRHPDGRPLKPATKVERRRALSIVGSSKQ